MAMSSAFDTLGALGEPGSLVFLLTGIQESTALPARPQALSFLTPDEFESQDFAERSEYPGFDLGLGTLLAGIAGVKLIVEAEHSTLNRSARSKCSQFLDENNILGESLPETANEYEELLRQTESIDSSSAEGSLREAIRHAYSQALSAKEISFDGLHCLISDLEAFEESLEMPLLFNFGIRLTSDVRTRLSALYRFLAYTRNLLVQELNLRFFGSPSLSARFDPLTDYYGLPLFDLIELGWYFGFEDSQLRKFGRKLLNVPIRKLLSKPVQLREHFAELLQKEALDPLWNARVSEPLTDEAATLSIMASRLGIDYQGYGEGYERLVSIAVAWHVESDAALLFKTLLELRGVRDGYHKVFYTFLDGGDSEEAESDQVVFPYACAFNPDGAEA